MAQLKLSILSIDLDLLDILVLNAVLECILDKTKKQVEVFWLSGEAVESTPSLSPAATMWFSPLFHYTGFVFINMHYKIFKRKLSYMHVVPGVSKIYTCNMAILFLSPGMLSKPARCFRHLFFFTRHTRLPMPKDEKSHARAGLFKHRGHFQHF